MCQDLVDLQKNNNDRAQVSYPTIIFVGITVLKSLIRMPPKKGFSGQAGNMHKDLFELLLVSTVETMQVKRLRTANGLYDENNWV